MNAGLIKLITLCVLATSIHGGQAKQRKQKPNRPPKIQSFTSIKTEVDLCPFFPGACSFSGTKTSIEVKATDPDKDELHYQYSATAGTIVGIGSHVIWDLTESRLGRQTVTVAVSDQRGAKVIRSTTLDVVVCGACDPPRPFLTVTCPDKVAHGEIADFRATVSGDTFGVELIYLWRHSHGRVVPGEDKTKLSVKALGLPGDQITATVRVLGLDPAANSEATCNQR